jgi:hypothetical protein
VLKILLVLATLLLSSCTFENSTDSSEKLSCSFIEAYLDDKALALKSAAEGGSAEEWIQRSIGELGKGFNLKSEQTYIEYLDAMLSWSRSVDQYVSLRNDIILTNAARELEYEINGLQIQCENDGWKFKTNWR